MSLPKVVSEARGGLSLPGRRCSPEEKRDDQGARRQLVTKRHASCPMVEITKDYGFEGPDGRASLLDLFEGRRQLVVGHFMFDPDWEDGCPSCTAGADEIAGGLLEHLHSRDTTFAYVSRAPIAKIEKYKAKRGWTFPWYSSFGSDFNYDFHVTLDESRSQSRSNTTTGRSRVRADGLAGLRRGRWPGPSKNWARSYARSCVSATGSSTPRAGYRMRRHSRRSAAPTTCSTRPRSGARRGLGRRRFHVVPWRAAPAPFRFLE